MLCWNVFNNSIFLTIDSSITNSSEVESLAIQPRKLLILDARSYAAAVANRAKGGGCECPGALSLCFFSVKDTVTFINMCALSLVLNQIYF